MKSQSTTTQLITITLLLALFVPYSSKTETIQYLDSEWKSFIQLRNVAIKNEEIPNVSIAYDEKQNTDQPTSTNNMMPQNSSENLNADTVNAESPINTVSPQSIENTMPNNQNAASLQNNYTQQITENFQNLKNDINNDLKLFKKNLSQMVASKMMSFKNKVSEAAAQANQASINLNETPEENEDHVKNSNLFANAHQKVESAKNQEKNEKNQMQNDIINQVKNSVENTNNKKPVDLKTAVGANDTQPSSETKGNLRKGNSSQNSNNSESQESNQPLSPEEQAILNQILQGLVKDSKKNTPSKEKLKTATPMVLLQLNEVLDSNRGKNLVNQVASEAGVSQEDVKKVLANNFKNLLNKHNEVTAASTTQSS